MTEQKNKIADNYNEHDTLNRIRNYDSILTKPLGSLALTAEQLERKEKWDQRKKKFGRFFRGAGRAAMMLPGMDYIGISFNAARIDRASGYGMFKQVGTLYKDIVNTISTDKPKKLKK